MLFSVILFNYSCITLLRLLSLRKYFFSSDIKYQDFKTCPSQKYADPESVGGMVEPKILNNVEKSFKNKIIKILLYFLCKSPSLT